MNREGRGNLSGGTRAKIKLNPLNMLGGQMMASAADKAVAGAKAQNIIDQSDWNANGDLNKSTQPTDRAGITPPKNAAPQFNAPNLGKAPGWWQNLLTQGGAGSMYAQAQYGGLQAQADAQNKWSGESAMENLRNQHAVEAQALANKHAVEMADIATMAKGGFTSPEKDRWARTGASREGDFIATNEANTAKNRLVSARSGIELEDLSTPEGKQAVVRGSRATNISPEVNNTVNTIKAKASEIDANAAYGNMLAAKARNILYGQELTDKRNNPIELGFGAKLVSQDGTVLADNPRPEDYHTQLLKSLGQGATTPGMQLQPGHIQIGNSVLVPKSQATPAQRTAPAPVTPPRNSFLPERGMDQGYIPTGAVGELVPQGVIDANRASAQTPLGDPVKKLLKYLGQAAYGISNDETRKQLDRTQIWNPTWGR